MKQHYTRQNKSLGKKVDTFLRSGTPTPEQYRQGVQDIQNANVNRQVYTARQKAPRARAIGRAQYAEQNYRGKVNWRQYLTK